MRHGPLEPFGGNAIPRIDTFLDRLVGLWFLDWAPPFIVGYLVLESKLLFPP